MVQLQYAKRNFFARSASVAAKGVMYATSQLDDLVLLLEQHDERIIVDESAFFGPGVRHRVSRGTGARGFMKHGPTVGVTRTRTQSGAPSLQEEFSFAFDRLGGYGFRGYAFSTLTSDARPRIVSLTEILEGQQLYCYAEGIYGDFGNSLATVTPYIDTDLVVKQGGEFAVRIPSRSTSRPHLLALHHVPVAATENPALIARRLVSSHDCVDSTFQDVHYDRSAVVFDAHDVAAYLHVAEHMLVAHDDATAFRFAPFAFLSQRMVGLHQAFCERVIVEHGFDGRHYKVPNRAEREMFLWAAAKQLGYASAFCPTKDRDGPLKEYSWD